MRHFKFESLADFKKKILTTLFPNETSHVLHARLKNIKQSESQSNIEFIDKFKAELYNLQNTVSNEVMSSDYFSNDIKKLFILNLKPKTRLCYIANKFIYIQNLSFFKNSIANKFNILLFFSKLKFRLTSYYIQIYFIFQFSYYKKPKKI